MRRLSRIHQHMLRAVLGYLRQEPRLHASPHHTAEARYPRAVGETYEITELAIRAAVEAGDIAREGFRSLDLEVAHKTDRHDLVTRYDRACEDHIRAVILGAYADSSIVGEEASAHHGAGPLTWFVDPIDGTANFARGIALWAVSIGVAREGEMIAGVIYDPVSGQLFWADERGAFLRDRFGSAEDRPMRSRGYSAPGDATIALNFPLPRDLAHRPELALRQFAEITLEFGQVRGVHSTCIALAWVAAGWIDATISFETNPWDIAAGCFIIRQAGGKFFGYEHGHVVSDSASHLAPHYFASAPESGFEMLHEVMRTQSMRPAR